ncbi:MAG: hypothetical protein JW837_01915 [Sedimentisphaerales bacterium]|nr:hypothetical protein [Sedimentisphaerales bacterium]
MQGRNFFRLVLFVVFFSIGAASLGVTILCDDLVRYYRSRNELTVRQQARDRLESLNADYDVLLEKLKDDPNLVKRLAPASLGIEPNDPNTVYPRPTPEQIDAARKALAPDPNNLHDTPKLPNWLTRCSEPRRRLTLFIAGSFLILISFTCFTPARQSKTKAKR